MLLRFASVKIDVEELKNKKTPEEDLEEAFDILIYYLMTFGIGWIVHMLI